VARVEITGVIYLWFDHVLRGAPRPAILADRVNFQVMGTNTWRHVPSLDRVSDDTLTLYLTNTPSGVGTYRALQAKPAPDAGDATLEVDLANRVVVSNVFIRPWPDSVLDSDNGVAFVGEPFAEPVTMSGSFVGRLEATVNAKDVDVAVVLYELTAKGEYIQLSYFLGRASYAHDRTTRRLLRPGVRESIPFWNTRMTSRRLGRGSRLVVVVTIPKGPGAQINYGTGKDVSDETIADAGAPRVLRLHGGSWVKVPVLRR
jgi:predicted acyl esterase